VTALPAAILGLVLAAPAETRGPLPGYLALIHDYARGERAQAVAGLGAWSTRALDGQFGEVSRLVRKAELCRCQEPLEGVSLRAAILLHMDRDRVEQPVSDDAEHPRPCPGRHAKLASRYASLLAGLPDGGDFARRYFLAMVLRCHWDFCLEEALPFGKEGLALFPRDADLLLALGAVYEKGAILAIPAFRTQVSGLPPGQRDDQRVNAAERRRWMNEARRCFDEAVAASPESALPRLRLGRVRYWLGEPEPARKAVQEALERTDEAEIQFLAHLFLGRIEEEAGRALEAVGEYRVAVAIDPRSQPAVVALAHALQLAGDAEPARSVLERGLAIAGRPGHRDAYWSYLMGDAERGQELVEALRRESLE
jgi:tetratricopeptide (TPR) repeat protein